MSGARRRGGGLLAAALFVLVVTGWVRPARAWVDVHVEGDDVRVSLDRKGHARVEHRVTVRIAGGPLRAFDLRGVDPDAAPEADGYAVPQKEAAARSLANATPFVAERMPPDRHPPEDGSPALTTLRLRFDEKGLGRGVYVLMVRYATDLPGRITQDGALDRIGWQSPVWDDGFDSARVTFELPGAPTEPRLADEGDHDPQGAGPVTPLLLSTLRRHADKDELELLRPYLPRGEVVTWAIRADARALRPVAEAARALPPPEPASVTGALVAPAHRMLVLCAGGLLMVLYGALVAVKARVVRRHARAAGVRERPVVAVPLAVRSAGAGLALVVGLALELALESGTLGAAMVLVAVLLAAHRTPVWSPSTSLRKPGRWLPVAEAEAFREGPRGRGGVLDVSTRGGKVLLVALLGALGGAVAFVAGISPYHAHLLAFDATALLAVFCTGRVGELPPDPAVDPVPFLRSVAGRVRKKLGGDQLRVLGRIRLPDGCPDPDELRLGLAPRAPIAGFISLEVGLVYAPGAGGALALPELLLRVTAGSECEKALERLARHGRSSRGRKADERVLCFSPRLPTARMTAAIAAALVSRVSRGSHGSLVQPEASGAGAARVGAGRKRAA